MPSHRISLDIKPVRAKRRCYNRMACRFRLLRRRQQSKSRPSRWYSPTKLHDPFPSIGRNRRRTKQSRRNQQTPKHPTPRRPIHHLPESHITRSITNRSSFFLSCEIVRSSRRIVKSSNCKAVWCVYSDTHRI